MFRNKKFVILILVIFVGFGAAMAAISFYNSNSSSLVNNVKVPVKLPTLSEIQKLILAGQYPTALAKTNILLKSKPNEAQIWEMKGICEFNLGQVSQAKVSFEKVLSLDPQNPAAKNYLGLLQQMPGRTVISSAVLNSYKLNQADFELRLGLRFDRTFVVFKEAIKRIPVQGILENIGATYTTIKRQSELKQYFSQLLQGAKLQFDLTEQSGRSIFQVKISDKKTVVISIWPGTANIVTVDYVQFQ